MASPPSPAFILSFSALSAAADVYIQPLLTYIAVVATLYYFFRPPGDEGKLAMIGLGYYITHVYLCGRLMYLVVTKRLFAPEPDITRENLLIVTEVWVMLLSLMAQRMITRPRGHLAEGVVLIAILVYMIHAGMNVDDDFPHRAACMWALTDTCRNTIVLLTGMFPALGLLDDADFFAAWNWTKTALLASVAYYHMWQVGGQPWFLFVYLPLVVFFTPEVTEVVRPVHTMQVPVLPMLMHSVQQNVPRLAGKVAELELLTFGEADEPEEEERTPYETLEQELAMMGLPPPSPPPPPPPVPLAPLLSSSDLDQLFPPHQE